MNRIFSLLIPLMLSLLAYQNCSDKTFSARENSTTAVSALQIEDQRNIGGDSSGGNSSGGSSAGGSTSGGTAGGASGGGSTSGGTTGGVNPGDVTQTKLNCDNARMTGKLKVLNQKIIFEDTAVETGRAQVCLFNTGYNLDMQNTVMQARYEQYHRLNLPANAVICDLDMATPLQRFRYDDVFVFTFNNRILATNNKTALYQTNPEGVLPVMNAGNVPIYNYDWLSLRSKKFENVADDYCLGSAQGASSCRWPITEQNGQIQFDFDQQLLIALGLMATPDKQSFGFIITGDNDPNIDCYHERLEFDMNVQYYIK
ncbi:hypothetical protein K2X05_11335 [bacterium]|nr:hypothetical protein [bacterium]